jgi:hypothetical protein
MMFHPLKRFLLVAYLVCLGACLGGQQVLGQQEIGFIEKFALANDRREALATLIPGTQEYYFFHCLHYQNEGQLSEAQAMLDAWRTKDGQGAQSQNMLLRQHLLTYSDNPQRTLQTLRDQLSLQLDHRAPSRDQAATLSSALDNATLDISKLLEEAIAQDQSLGRVASSALGLLLKAELNPAQLRAVLQRLTRADLAGVVARIAEELKLKDSQGFGWTQLHAQLTLSQFDELLTLVPNLLENDKFVRAYTQRLSPAAGVSLTDKVALRSYLLRLQAWSDRLPASQSNFKANVLGNLLRLEMSEGQFDRALFIKYLALPRRASYYNIARLNGDSRRLPAVELGYAMNPEAQLPPIGNDDDLVRRYLEHFLQSSDRVDDFATYLNREYLDRVLAETKILYGLGDAATWYAKLSPVEQKSLRERVELRFAPQNAHQYAPADEVKLNVELKNVQQLVVKIYEINTLSYYRSQSKPIDTALDLDGLVANAERKIEYSQPADRRHIETLTFPEMAQRGVWIVDILGGGGRSRALIQKGQFGAIERLGDAGQVFKIVDEAGNVVPTAHLELNGQVFKPNTDGNILLPYAEETVTRNLLLVDDTFASQALIANFAETYALQAGFHVERQSLVAGAQAQVAVNVRLTCNGQPINVKLLEDARLTIIATDHEGISTSQVVEALTLEDGDELTHSFLVPQSLANIRFELSGRVYNRSRDVKQDLSAASVLACNAIAQTPQIGDFYLRATPAGYELLVLGRNGEPLASQPVSLQVKLRQFNANKPFSLASDKSGVVQLGMLENVERVSVDSTGMSPATFDLSRFHRSWPTNIQVGAGESIELPLGKAAASKDQFSLFEVRGRAHYADWSSRISIMDGSMKCTELTAGDYLLVDHEAGQRVSIRVSEAQSANGYAVGKHRILQVERRSPLIIRNVSIEGDELLVRIEGADAMSRLHVIANPLFPDTAAGPQLQLPYSALAWNERSVVPTLYIDSLRLDEEYSYILDRQGLKKYPGNLLAQPSVLVNPWEVSVTENTTQEAAPGDPLASKAAAPPSRSLMEGEAADSAMSERPDWKSYNFLARNAALATNLAIEDGVVRIPLEKLKGYSTVTVVAVHPTTVDSRRLTLPATELAVRDQRLGEAFDAKQRLAQTQRTQLLAAGAKVSLGDARTRRLQTYSDIASVFQLYSTLLNNPDWEKFRFVTNWHQLSDEEKRANYNETACHELNFFLFHKDRKFFDTVVKPLIEQKLDKQLVDDWLLGRSLDQYAELWRQQRLNTLERVLLAERIASNRAGALRWLNDTVAANPLDPQWRARRFEAALRGSELETTNLSLMRLSENRLEMQADGLAMMGGVGGAMAEAKPAAEAFGRGGAARARRNTQPKPMSEPSSPFGLEQNMDRFAFGEIDAARFFQTLDKTREWAETQYYHVRLAEQTAALIPTSPFWLEFLQHNGQPFLTEQLDIPCSNLHEALCALAVIALPLDGKQPTVSVEENELVIQTGTAAIAFLESIEASEANATKDSILIGQDIYLVQPSISEDANRPVQDQPLLLGVPYRASVVVTNPTSTRRSVAVLTQLPAGSLPLSGSKLTRSTALELEAYSTAQVSYEFYFPAAGQFEHYGAQISDGGKHIASTESRALRVLAEPETVDETTWSYVADWGTNAQVLKYLDTANLMKLDLSRIAFRMKDKSFFASVTNLLAASARFEPTLWAYAVVHNQPGQIQHLLQNRPDLVQKLGVEFTCPLIEVHPREQLSYEHLDYRPLVAARAHQLGAKRKILNANMHTQYHRLLDVIAHQRAVKNEQRLSLCYYLLLQNRIEEALAWFDQVEVAGLETRLQYDYFAAYLDFYRGEFDRAAKLASNYAAYPVPRWRELFSQIVRQVAERNAIIAGESIESQKVAGGEDSSEQRLLVDGREAQQAAMAATSPALDLTSRDGQLVLTHRNVDSVQVNYYLMDIELLFSRNPFVVRGDDSVPVIRPNLGQRLTLNTSTSTQAIPIPAEIRNRNVLVEVSTEGISRSSVVTANTLSVNLTERMGRLQVQNAADRSPAVGAYVKVYAKHADGTSLFYKDGYTDLRGQFDYATLSTSELDSVQRFAILILDQERGAIVREAAPPSR